MSEDVETIGERKDDDELMLPDVPLEQAVKEHTINTEIPVTNIFFILHLASIFRKPCYFLFS